MPMPVKEGVRVVVADSEADDQPEDDEEGHEQVHHQLVGVGDVQVGPWGGQEVASDAQQCVMSSSQLLPNETLLRV